MHLKQKNHSIDIVVATVILMAGVLVWSLSRSYALIQDAGASVTNSISNNIQPTTSAETRVILEPETVQFALMQEFHNKLTSTLDSFAKSEPNTYGIVVKHLATGDKTSVNADQQIHAASLYKPIVALQALRLVDRGQASLDEVLPETDDHTLAQCIELAISISDNPCGHALMSRTNLSSTNGLAIIRQLGLKHTDLRGEYPITTAGDTTLLFEKIYNQELLSKKSNQFLLDALLAQKVNNRLPQGLPDNTKIAHKTGDLEGVAHDGGIVYTSAGDYIIVIMSDIDSSGRSLDTRYARMAELTAQVHKIMVSAPQLDDAS